MKQVYDITGKAFSRLKVISLTRVIKHRGAFWICLCECGNETEVRGACLKNGSIKSCGCLQRESRLNASKTHGMSRDSNYHTWSEMIQRCTNQRRQSFKWYGGRGIKVCDRWLTYENFLEDVGLRPSEGHSLDRFPNGNGNYEPGNVRWATKTEQVWNRRNSLMIEIDGTKKPLTVWALEFGIPKLTVWNRFKRGWPTDKLFMPPLRGGRLNQ